MVALELVVPVAGFCLKCFVGWFYVLCLRIVSFTFNVDYDVCGMLVAECT